MNEGINQINIDVEIFILIKKVTYKEKANHIDLHTVMDVIIFVSDLQQAGGCLRILQFPPTATI
jgi:hypothetical protein